MRTRPRLSRTTKRRKPDERRRDVNAVVNVKNGRIEKRYAHAV